MRFQEMRAADILINPPEFENQPAESPNIQMLWAAEELVPCQRYHLSDQAGCRNVACEY